MLGDNPRASADARITSISSRRTDVQPCAPLQGAVGTVARVHQGVARRQCYRAGRSRRIFLLGESPPRERVSHPPN